MHVHSHGDFSYIKIPKMTPLGDVRVTRWVYDVINKARKGGARWRRY